MKTNYLKIIEDYNKRVNYTENEKKFRMDRLNRDASEIALYLVLDSKGYKIMKATGFKQDSVIVIGVEKIKDVILDKYQLPMTNNEAIMFVSKALEDTRLFRLVHIDTVEGQVRALLDFSKLEMKPEGFKEFNVVVDCGYKLNVREKPALMSKIIRTLDDKTTVRVYGEYDEWYKIRDGYICKKFTKLEKPFGGIK